MSRGNSMCGWMRADERGGRFHTDPSGTFIRYEAKAVGSGSEAAQSELQDKWHKVRRLDRPLLFSWLMNWHQQITLKEAHILTLRVLKQVMEEKLDQHNVQLAQVRYSFCIQPTMLSFLVIGHSRQGFRDSRRSQTEGADR